VDVAGGHRRHHSRRAAHRAGAQRAAASTSYPWALAALFSAASVAFNIAHAPDRPVAQLVFAMAPVALVLTTHLLMQQASWRRPTPDHPAAPGPEVGHQARPEPAHLRKPVSHPAHQPAPAGQGAPAGARARVLAAYQTQLAAGQTPTGAALARAAGVSERYGQRLLAEFTADPTLADHPNGDSRAGGHQPDHDAEGR
jgi:Protein of unknown function (DUF2637)